MKAIAEPTRNAIALLLLERAASTTELAIALGKPKGTVDHHLKVLARAGLVHVVRTRQVRAMTERFWGRTARTFMFESSSSSTPTSMWMVRDALEEMSRVMPETRQAEDDAGPEQDGKNGVPDTVFATFRHARIPADRAREFGERLYALSDEFVSAERGGDVMFGLLLTLYPTDLPILPEPVA
ncbi:MAG: transcriptional regulator, TrmB [Acidimicrobiales bacterium]|nr:transcriptional regulator, TrmB [Acidimicrobiales bacterium]